eukprot:gene48327-65560_t
MVYGIIGMINFAHGDIFMLGGFAALIAFLVLTTFFAGVPVAIALLVMLPAMGIAYLIMRRTDYIITRPILDIRDVAREVVQTGDYSRRAAPTSEDEVAQLVESLMRVAPRRQPEPAPAAQPIRQARYCYDHLAGSLGTGLLALLLRKGWLVNDSSDTAGKQLELTSKGARAFTTLG